MPGVAPGYIPVYVVQGQGTVAVRLEDKGRDRRHGDMGTRDH